MAINVFTVSTLNANTNASPRASGAFSNAAGGNVTLSWDSAVITTHDQLTACVNALLTVAQGQLTGP